MAEYKDLLGPDGSENNMGGTSQYIYIASVADILTYASAAQNATNPYVHTQPFVMKPGKKFWTLYTTIYTSEIESGSNGEIDGKSFKPSVKVFYPGLSDDALLVINRLKNDKLVLLVPLADDTIVQVGTAKFHAFANPNFKSTTTSGRGKGTEIEFMSFQPNFLKYAAAIPTTPAA
jgi:hypothetical protein